MADGQAPDQTQALLQMQSLIASANGTQGKGSPILAVFLPGAAKDVAFKNMSLQQGFGDKCFAATAQSRPGIIESLKQQLGLKAGQIFEDAKKCGQNVAVMYSGDLPNGSLPSGSAGGGSIVGSRGGSIEI